jgi:hypothetical protein
VARRDEEKRRRRQKRRDKKHRGDRAAGAIAPRQPQGDPADRLEAVLRNVQRHLQVPMPTHWPGAGDPSLQRPDLVKLELAEFATGTEPGRSKARLFERQLRQGLLGFLPDFADHWGVEEFLWHGLPGDPWQPLEAFLAHAGDRFPPAAGEQLRLWKQARLGAFEVGEVRDETVALREWAPVSQTEIGSPVRAITLNIGGVNYYQDKRGQINLTYLAPWVPAQDLFCGLGYGMSLSKRDSALLIPYLGLRHPEVVARPLPWKQNRAAADQYLRQWREREWQGWLAERLKFPFPALINLPPEGKPELKLVQGMLPNSPQQAWQFGIYLRAEMNETEILAAGATNVTPTDVTSPNTAALAEYKAYRDRVGPPPGTRGQPNYLTIE